MLNTLTTGVLEAPPPRPRERLPFVGVGDPPGPTRETPHRLGPALGRTPSGLEGTLLGAVFGFLGGRVGVRHSQPIVVVWGTVAVG
jgi:hypothetical protein